MNNNNYHHLKGLGFLVRSYQLVRDGVSWNFYYIFHCRVFNEHLKCRLTFLTDWQRPIHIGVMKMQCLFEKIHFTGTK
jgi:hypothetical protein